MSSGSHGVIISRQSMEHGAVFHAKSSLVRLPNAKLLSLLLGMMMCGIGVQGDRYC